MDLAKLSADGQITVPVEVRVAATDGRRRGAVRRENARGELVVNNAAVVGLMDAQRSFAGAAKDFGVTDDDGVQALVDEVRHGSRTE